jgi:hypothetical protein
VEYSAAQCSNSGQPITFLNGCDTINQIPFIENFDSYTPGVDSIPNCWYRNYIGFSNPNISSVLPYSSPNSLSFITTDTTYSMIVLPEINQNIPIDTLQISFKGKMGYGGGVIGENLMIGVMNDPNDFSTFFPIDTIVLTMYTALYYQIYTFPLTSYTGNGKYIAIKSDLRNYHNENDFVIDDIVIDYAPTCLPPSNVLISNVTSTGATVSWTPHSNGNANSYQVACGLIGFNPNSVVPASVNDTFFTITGLSAITQYRCYIRSVCSGGVYSLWTPVSSFSTNFAAPVPYFMPFNECTFFPPDYYEPNGWGIDSTRGVKGNPPCNMCTDFALNNGSQYYFKTIAIGPLSNHMELTFDYKFAFYDPPYYPAPSDEGCFYLSISKDFGTSFTVVDTIYPNCSNDYQTYRLNLAAYANEYIKIMFRARSFGDKRLSLGIDNISVADSVVCRKPTDLRFNAIDPNSITLAWNETCSATNWIIEFGPSGFTHGNGTILLAQTNPIFIGNLLSATTYDFYIKSICSVQDTSLWSNKYTVKIPCSLSTIPFIENFDDSTMPECWSQTYTGNLYRNIWDIWNNAWSGGTPNEMRAAYLNEIGLSRLISPMINLTGYSNPILTFKYKYSDDPGSLNFKIQTSVDKINWIDQPFSFSSGNGSIGPTTAYVPLNLAPGNHYIAWVIEGNHFDFMFWAIDEVAISATPLPCLMPTNLTIDSTLEHEATISWTPGCYETQWKIEYLLMSDTNWTEVFSTTPSITLQNLQNNSYYLIRVKAMCTNSESDFTQPILLATFVNPTIYVINASCGENGTIYPSGNIPVTSGESQSFTFTPNSNYQLATVLIDGIAQTLSTNQYVFANVLSDHTIYVDFSAGIEDQINENWIQIYPNPTISLINVYIDLKRLESKECNIYDVYGQLIKNVLIQNELTTLDLSEFASGVYYFIFETKNGISYRKIVKR